MSLIGGSVNVLPNGSRPAEVVILDSAGNIVSTFGGGGSSSIGANATITTIPPTNVSQTLLAQNPARKSFEFINDTNKTALLAYGPNASSTIRTVLVPARTTVERSNYSGIISVIWDNVNNGTATVTEIT